MNEVWRAYELPLAPASDVYVATAKVAVHREIHSWIPQHPGGAGLDTQPGVQCVHRLAIGDDYCCG
jgi:hypothetical protein